MSEFYKTILRSVSLYVWYKLTILVSDASLLQISKNYFTIKINNLLSFPYNICIYYGQQTKIIKNHFFRRLSKYIKYLFLYSI